MSTEPKHLLLGRVGTNLKIGIVGLPNVGKSTFFNVLTKSSIPAENFPFCTIDPNTSQVAVPDERFDWLVAHKKPQNSIPAVLHITDIAGLVQGANEGQGLGNAFLSHIGAVDAIFHVVRVFDDPAVTHVEGNIDPIRDMEIISNELVLKDIQFLEMKRDSLVRVAKGDKHKKREMEVAEKALQVLKEEKRDIRFADWSWQDIEFLNQFQLLTAKPVVYLANMSPRDYMRRKNKWLPKVKQWIDARSNNTDLLLPFSAEFETNLASMDDEARQKFEEENNTKSALPRIIHAGYNALNLIHYFTAGEKEVRCWTIKKGTKAPAAGGKIHSDFEKTFINAEVIHFDDFKELKSEAECRAQGKMMMQGKNYVVQDGDIIHFKCGKRG